MQLVPRPQSPSVPVIAVLAVGLVLTVIVAAFIRSWVNEERQNRAAQVSAEHVEALRGHLIRSMEVLYSIASLFEARREISRQEFRDFVSDTLSRRPEIQGLAWDPRVPGLSRSQWEAHAREEGIGEFQIVEQSPDGRLVPAGQRL